MQGRFHRIPVPLHEDRNLQIYFKHFSIWLIFNEILIQIQGKGNKPSLFHLFDSVFHSCFLCSFTFISFRDIYNPVLTLWSIRSSKYNSEDSVRISRKQWFFIININWLMQFIEIIPVYSESYMKPVNTLCGQNAKSMNDKASRIYNCHCAWKA